MVKMMDLVAELDARFSSEVPQHRSRQVVRGTYLPARQNIRQGRATVKNAISALRSPRRKWCGPRSRVNAAGNIRRSRCACLGTGEKEAHHHRLNEAAKHSAPKLNGD